MISTQTDTDTPRVSLDYVVRLRQEHGGHDDDAYREYGAEWGLMPDDGDDLRVLMVPDGTADDMLDAIETLLDTDETVAEWCPLVDPGEALDDAAWASAIVFVRS